MLSLGRQGHRSFGEKNSMLLRRTCLWCWGFKKPKKTGDRDFWNGRRMNMVTSSFMKITGMISFRESKPNPESTLRFVDRAKPNDER